MAGPGEKSVTINDTDGTYTKDADIQDLGTYSFDIHVQDSKTGDWQGIISDVVRMANHEVILTQDPDANIEALAGYKIQSDRDASLINCKRQDLI
jgi:hypothetical protein